MPHIDPDEDDKKGRFQTIFLYLADIGAGCGGETIFPRLRKNGRMFKVRPRKGTAVAWHNLTKDGEINDFFLHGSTPITCRKTKIGLNVWLRKSETAK